MQTIVTLGRKHFNAAAKRARELGTSTDAYIERLIDADALSFDEVLAPIRDKFRASGVTEDKLDAVDSARKAIAKKRRSRKPTR